MTAKSQVILILYIVVGSVAAAASEVEVNWAQSQKVKRECSSGRDLMLQDRKGFRVDFVRYHQGEYPNESDPLMVILPPTGGINAIDRTWGYMFCRAGYTALVIKSYTGSDEVSLDLGVHERVMSNSVHAFDMIRKKYENDFFGILGTSAGGILAASLVDDLKGDLDAIFTVVTGAPLHSVIARAGERGLKQLREKRMESLQFKTIEEYENAIYQHLDVKIPENPPAGLKIGMAIALEDETVPTVFQERLAFWWKPQYLIRMKRGHTSAIGSVAVQHRGKILDFFNSAR